MLRNPMGAASDLSLMVNAGSLARSSNEDVPQETAEDAASYLFDLLVAARRLAVTRRHKFLAYLIGMAAEEARLLTQGRSAVRSGPSKAAG